MITSFAPIGALARSTTAALLVSMLAACGDWGGDPPSYALGGTVTGLNPGAQVVLSNNGVDPVTVSADGAFGFAKPVSVTDSYLVTITTQPAGQTCSVANYQGVRPVANVTNVAVTCSTNTFTVIGAVAGLAAGQQITLNNNGANPTTVTANGAFIFSTPVPYNGSYAVTVATQPIGKTCTVSNGSGAGVVANITNVTVTCSTNTFTIGGSVAGLAAGQQLTLYNNGADPTNVTANGAFSFATPVAFDGSYSVAVGTQPIGQTCSVSNGTGAGVVANITNVTVTCSTNTYTIGGTVSGLAAGQQVTLSNGAEFLTRNADGGFAFATPVAYNGSYAVTVSTQPTGQICSVASGSGSGVTANVTTVTVTCSTLTYTIGGTVSGLAAGQQVTLNNNVANPTTVTANGAFTFSTAVPYNGSYAVGVGTQPTGQTCSVANGSGSGVTANVTNVTVTCSTLTYTIGGTVTGLAAGQQVTLNNNGANPTTVAANGAFTFSTPVTYNGAYAVTVGTQPTGQTCSVANGSGAGVVANITNVTVTCSTNTYTIGGTISGLSTGQQVTLSNGAEFLTRNVNGAFTFVTPVAYNGSYSVSVSTQPTGQTCSVSNGSGAGVVANITNVTVTCSTNTYTIGGTISGLATGQQVTLRNGAEFLTRTVNGAFTFVTPVAYNGSYSVSVSTQPTGQTCSVSNGSGAGVVANITNVTVTCSTNTYTIGGTISGLASGQQVTLRNGAEFLTRNVNGAFTFVTPVAFNGSYAVTVGTQPTGQTCTVANGSGAGVVANITNVTVTCSTNTYTIGGTVTGLAAGQQVTLRNGAEFLTRNADGAFTFVTPVAYNGSYSVSVSTQPTGQTCSVSNGSGAGVVANITNVTVTCSTNTYTIGGTISGLATGQQVTLRNGAEFLTRTVNGAFTFVTPVAYNGSYSVSVSTQPTGQTCSVSNGSGAGVVANITNVTVTCSTNTYTIGGTISGLASGQQVTLRNGAEFLTRNVNGAFTFVTPVAFNGSYAVTVGTQPTGQTCTVANGSGAGVVANITNVTVTCSTNTYTIGVTVTGLAAGQQVTLNNNGGDPLTVTFGQQGTLRTFSTPVSYNGVYLVTVGTQPTGTTCTVANGSGSGVTADVTNVTVTCSTSTFTIGGTVSGLTAGQQVTLNNNGADPTTVTANGAFTFSTPVTYNGAYAVTVGTQPAGQSCTVSNGSGSGVTANVTNVAVTCI